MATQTERRASTRRALLDAAHDVLVAHGIAATTTAEIAERAGFSQGALFRHFPTKADLLVAVVEDLYPRLVSSYVAALHDRITPGGSLDVVEDLLRPLLGVMRAPGTRAGTELLVAARTDPDLAARIAAQEASHRQQMRDAARPLLREVAAPDTPDADLDALVDLAIDLTAGIALTSAIADADRVEGELSLAGRLLAPLLAAR